MKPAGPLLAALAVALAAGALCLVPRPTLDNSIDAMLVDHSPRAQRYAAFQARFAADEVIVVRMSGLPAPALFRRAVALERALADDPAIAATLGPASAYEAEFDLLLDEALGGFDELPRLAPRFGGPLGEALAPVSLEPPAARIYAFCRPGRPADRARVEALLAEARAAVEADGGEVRIAGPPILNLALDRAGRSVETTSLPLLVGVCVLLMVALTRSVRQTIAALVPVGLGVGAMMGALSLAGHTTDIVINIAQPLVFVLLLASGLHVVVAWQDARRRGLDRAAAPWTAAREKARAVALALGTTALGFASLGWSDMPSIRAFGLLAALGLGLGLPLVLLVLPALLHLLGGDAARMAGGRLGAFAAWCVDRSLRRPWIAPIVAVAVTLAGLVAATALPVSTGGVHYFDAEATVRQDYEALRAAGVGLSTVEALIEPPGAAGPPSPALLADADRFARRVEDGTRVMRAVGLPLLLREGHWRLTGQDALPAGPALDEALAADEVALFAADGAVRLSFLIAHLDAAALDALYADIRARFAETFGPDARLTLTGHHELVVQAQASLVDTLMWSLLTTALLIELIILVALRSLRLALAALLPMLAPVCLNFGLMAAFGIPLDLGTCMTGAIALGIAVDDALHFMIAWQKAPPRETALGTGRALVLTSVVIAAGFLSLLGAPFAPTARFGLLCALAMLSALLADLLVLPPLLQRLAPYRARG